MAKIIKRISNRVYPSRDCKQCSRQFIPTDARQIFCGEQHRVDFNNDLRKVRAAPVIAFTNKILKNHAALKKISESLKLNKQTLVNIDLLHYEGFDSGIYSEVTINETNGKKVYWSLGFAIEGVDESKNTFKLYKRK